MLFYFIDMKVCNKCKEEKELSEFIKKKDHKDGLSNDCKSCRAIYQTKYNRTKDGKLSSIYNNQVRNSKQRGHEEPKYTKQEFVDKYINNQRYLSLYINWVGSGYLKYLAPSFDRLDDYKGYGFDNLQIITWFENESKSHSDKKNGVNNKNSKAVVGINIETGKTIEFHSMMEAKRSGFIHSHIWSCCNGKRKTHRGYKWGFKN
jgi:hypothetical protein